MHDVVPWREIVCTFTSQVTNLASKYTYSDKIYPFFITWREPCAVTPYHYFNKIGQFTTFCWNDDMVSQRWVPHETSSRRGSTLFHRQLNSKNNDKMLIVKLFPGNIAGSFDYLLYDHVPSYKVVCDGEINLTPYFKSICIPLDDQPRPEIKGVFDVVEILDKCSVLLLDRKWKIF